MFEKLGVAGVLGVLVLLAGIGIIATENLIVAGGVALVIAGLGFLVYGVITQLAKAMGMEGMV